MVDEVLWVGLPQSLRAPFFLASSTSPYLPPFWLGLRGLRLRSAMSPYAGRRG